ncbi:hypothetical protein Tco_0706652 [Tanacetum coccineum]|uniref:Gag-Pol polyprotein n=1 Tax=Tanacetum coccineum TaxID=301880 RepID=A0ABQ4Y831_9ASTR
MSTSNQQTLADSGANDRPLMLEKGNYIPWESRFRRFMDNKLKDGEWMWDSIEKGPYTRRMIPNPYNPQKEIIEPLSKMTEGNKKQYIADVKERIKRLMFGSDVTSLVRHSRLMDEFDKFAPKEGESIESVYERLTMLVNIMDRNNVRPIPVSINTKFINCLQPEWSKYVTMVRHNQTGDAVSYDVLYDSLIQFKQNVLASKAKKATKNHDPLALLAQSNASSSQSHANSSYSPQPYYVTHPSSVVDYEDEYQGELQEDSQEDKLTTAMMNPGRQNMNQVFNAGNGNDDSNQIVQRVPQTESTPRKLNIQSMKDEAGSNLEDEENDFMLDNSYGEETIEELTAAVMLIHVKCKTIIQTSDDDQIDSNIIFDDPYVENNGGTSEHDSNAHDEYHEIQMLAYNVQREAKNQKRLNNELKKQKELLQKELEMCKDRVKTFKSKIIQCSKYKETCEELERELQADKDTIERILKEKDKIQSDFFKTKNEKLIIEHETQLAKMIFKE